MLHIKYIYLYGNNYIPLVTPIQNTHKGAYNSKVCSHAETISQLFQTINADWTTRVVEISQGVSYQDGVFRAIIHLK